VSSRLDAFTTKVHQLRKLYAELVGLVAEMDREHDAAKAGYGSLSGLLVDATRISPRTANAMVKQAEQITETLTPTGHLSPAPLPTAREALLEGAVDGEHLDVIAKVMKDLPDTASFADRELVETTLGAQARVLDPVALRKFGQQVLQRIDQDGREPEDKTLAEPVNSLRYRRTTDNRLVATLDVEPETAEVLEGLLLALGAPQPPAPGVSDPRSQAQRYGDALCDIVHLAAKAPEVPSQGGCVPQVSVVMPLDTLTDSVGTATLDSGTPLCPEAARRVACDAAIIPIVLNGESVPLDVGRANRLVNVQQRKALIARDHGCAFPGCTRTPRWCDAHHVTHWKDGGPTDLGNLVLLCRYHHRIVHHSEWGIRMMGGLPYFLPPAWLNPARTPMRSVLRR
jgi:hypothetical protein